MAFDIEGAKKAGYNDAEIADHLAKQSNFDLAGAKKAGYNDAEILQHLASAPAATPETRAPATDAIPQGRNMRGGFARQVGEALANPAETPRIPMAAELGTRYGDIGKGAAQGVPAAVLGLPGDVASLVVDNPLTSHAIGNAMFGEANPDVAAGRTIGGLVTGFAAPAMAGKLGAAKNALAASYPLAAKGVGAAQTVLDPLSPIVAGAINAGARGAKAMGNIGRAAEEATPTTAALLNDARDSYRVMDQSNLAIHPDVLQSAVGDIKKSLETSRYVEELDPVAKNFLKVLEDRAQSPQSLTQLDALRGKARDLAFEATGGEQKVLSTISRKLDETLNGLDVSKVVPKDATLPSADPTMVKDALAAARDKFGRAAKSAEIETLIHKADVSTQDNPIKALRTQFSTLAKNEDRLAQYSAAEQKIIKNIAAGNIGSSTLQGLENLMPGFSQSSMFGNVMSALAGVAGSSLGGPIGSLAFSIPGAIGKTAEKMRGAQAMPFANQFAEGIRAGNVGNAMAPPFTSTAAVRNFLRPGVGAYNTLNNQ